MTRRQFSILNSLDAEDDDPVLSTINLIDVFMVVIGMLMIAVIDNPMNPFAHDTLTIIRNEGRTNMEILTQRGQEAHALQGQRRDRAGQRREGRHRVAAEGWDDGLRAGRCDEPAAVAPQGGR
jgi:hypothetical protein